jgi:hypothetical protein
MYVKHLSCTTNVSEQVNTLLTSAASGTVTQEANYRLLKCVLRITPDKNPCPSSLAFAIDRLYVVKGTRFLRSAARLNWAKKHGF